VNDTFGRQVGDDVLRAVAKILTNRCDGRNRVEYRYGGEELTEYKLSLREYAGNYRVDSHRTLIALAKAKQVVEGRGSHPFSSQAGNIRPT
jgi:diguanylate cyclase (GGDEF)-like protein